VTGWDGSTRRETLPPDWEQRVAAVRARSGGRCEQIKSNGRRCANPSREVDHAVERLDHAVDHLRDLCYWHHRVKTQAEATAARWPSRQKTTPVERHPGMRRK
jgi:5-methylcytosine-specific restriction enzyme A